MYNKKASELNCTDKDVNHVVSDKLKKSLQEKRPPMFVRINKDRENKNKYLIGVNVVFDGASYDYDFVLDTESLSQL